ncbi:MAG TPA: hypothetical protein VMN56_03520, partial [Casimicrobiaceae bacterium]|nr:hypothetical protein [Casimicrobiaceae bacterium]
ELPLLDFIPAVTPQVLGGAPTLRPYHLQDLCDGFQRAETERVRMLCSVAAQFGKSTTVLNALIRYASRCPGQTHAYISYGASFAQDQGQIAWRIAEAAGLEPRGRRDRWHIKNESEFYFTGVDGILTGRPITGLLIIDDPYKNRQDAESALMRKRVREFCEGTAFVRAHGSVFVIHSRWRPDDLIGALESDPLWGKSIAYPAILGEGETRRSLWPEKWSLADLDLRRHTMASDYDWASLMMCTPKLRGQGFFRDVWDYDEAPKHGYRAAIGVDLAMSEGNDFSCAVVLAEQDGKYYVLNVRRRQCRASDFAPELRELKAAYPNAHLLWHASPQEREIASLLRERLGFTIMAVPAVDAKSVRASPVAQAWNSYTDERGDSVSGRVLVPSPRAANWGPWVADFTKELNAFTGDDDARDDQVDALSSAFHLLKTGANRGKAKAHSGNFGRETLARKDRAPKIKDNFQW